GGRGSGLRRPPAAGTGRTLPRRQTGARWPAVLRHRRWEHLPHPRGGTMSLQFRLLSLIAAGVLFVACTHSRPSAVVQQRDPASLDGDYQACEEIREVVYQAPRVNYGTLTRTYANVRDNVFKQH